MHGKIISHYRILEKIGGGGMGTVYKAEDTKLRRTVALKFLAPELTRDEEAKKRFVHEAQAASALDHPNICSIFDIDETPEGQLFIAMACYDGESLKERIARRKLDVREAFEIAFSVAQGLARAHASGIVHRDIKPGNIMITSDGFVKIVDFGLAKLIGRSRITGSGATLGTVAYMSPEQARSEDADARADIWSVGAVLYEMIAGRLPFRGEIDQAMVYSILNESPAPLRELRSDVPDACIAVVNKCLEKDPERRYQSALEFCSALIATSEKLGWGGSFATGTVRSVSIVRGGHARRGKLALPLTAAALVLAIAGTLAWLQWRHDSIYSTEIRLAVMPFERLGDTPSQAFVDGLSQWVAGAFDRAGRARESMWTMPFMRVVEDRPADLDRVASTFGVNRLITGDVQRFETNYRVSLALLDGATLKPLKSEAVEFSFDRLDELPNAMAATVARMLDIDSSGPAVAAISGPNSQSDIGVGRFFEGLGYNQRYASASSLDSAEVALTGAIAADNRFAPALAAQGYCFYLHWFKSREPDELRRAEPVLRRAIAVDSTYVPSFMCLAKVMRYSGRGEVGVDLLQRAIAIDPGYIEAYQDLGDALASLQRYDEAEACYLTLIANEPDYFHGHWRLGWLYRLMNRPEQEFDEHRRAQRLAPADYRTLNSLGLYYSERGDWESAREYFEESFILHPSYASSSNVGSVMYYQGRFGDSARYYEYALEYTDSTNYVDWGNLACALYWADGRRDEGVAMYRKAIALAEKRLSQAHDDAATTARLADYYGMVGERESALAMIERSTGLNDVEVFYRLACAYASLGDTERAIEFIGKAVREHYPIHEVEREPLFRELVRDARLRSMLEIASRERGEG